MDTFKGQGNEKITMKIIPYLAFLKAYPINFNHLILSSASQQNVLSKRNRACGMLNRSETNLMKDVDHVEVSLNLSQVKPLHAE